MVINNLAMAWIDYKKKHKMLDNKLSQNVQDIRRRHKLYRENHENQKSGIDSNEGKA